MTDGLTTRESECVRLAGQGLEDKEIAARLRISPRTVGNHLHREMRACASRRARSAITCIAPTPSWAFRTANWRPGD